MEKKKKGKNKVLRVIGIIFVTLLLLIIILPMIFKNQIAAKALQIANENVNAEIAIDKVSLSIFRSFPDLQFGMKGLRISGVAEHAGTELASVENLWLDIDLGKALKKEIKINSILVESPRINAVVLENGNASWDISKGAEAEQEVETAAQQDSIKAFNVDMESFEIRDAVLIYNDRQQDMLAEVTDLDVQLEGDLSTKVSQLKLNTSIGSINFEQGGVSLAKEIRLLFEAVINLDLEAMKFSFAENKLQINELGLGFAGSVEMPEDGSMITDINFYANETDFRTLLSFVPDSYRETIEGLKTEGNLKFTGFAKGVMKDDLLPAFGVDLTVTDAMVQYPELPSAIKDINIDIKVANPGGEADKTTIAVNRFELALADNPVRATAQVSTPVSDPDISADLDMDINLGTIKNVLPLAGMELSGTLDARMKIDTRLSTIENEEFEKVGLTGGVNLNQFSFKSKDLNERIAIDKAELKFTPRYVELKKFYAKAGTSDLQLTGKVENFIPFVLEDKLLSGNLSVQSALLDMNNLSSLSKKDESAEKQAVNESKAESSEVQVVMIPDNIRFTLNCDIDKIIFDQLYINKLTGNMELREGKANLDNLSLKTLDGNIRLRGSYYGESSAKAVTAANLDVSGLDLKKGFNSFAVLKDMLPVLDYASGNVSGKIELDAELGEGMQPVQSALNSEGNLKTSRIIIEDSPVLKDIAQSLKNEKLSKVNLSPADVSYVITNGTLKISPFTTEFYNSSATVSGTVMLEGDMDIAIAAKLAIADLGSEARKQINDLVKQIKKAGLAAKAPDYLEVPIKITGTVDKPVVQLDWQKAFNAVIKSLQDQLLKSGTDKVKDEATEFLKGLFK